MAITLVQNRFFLHGNLKQMIEVSNTNPLKLLEPDQNIDSFRKVLNGNAFSTVLLSSTGESYLIRLTKSMATSGTNVVITIAKVIAPRKGHASLAIAPILSPQIGAANQS